MEIEDIYLEFIYFNGGDKLAFLMTDSGHTILTGLGRLYTSLSDMRWLAWYSRWLHVYYLFLPWIPMTEILLIIILELVFCMNPLIIHLVVWFVHFTHNFDFVRVVCITYTLYITFGGLCQTLTVKEDQSITIPILLQLLVSAKMRTSHFDRHESVAGIPFSSFTPKYTTTWCRQSDMVLYFYIRAMWK